MDKRTLELIRWQRAKNRCEYCQLPQEGHEERFSIDHVIAKKHGDLVTLLYHPREQSWREHFRWDGCIVVGLTPTGRATVNVLQMNVPARVRLRQALRVEGIFDPGRPV